MGFKPFSLRNVSVSQIIPLPTSVYLHLPFCLQKCHYCVFPVHFLGGAKDSPLIQHYIDNLLREITLTLSIFHPKAPQAIKLKTLYFGGGTPSLFPSKDIKRVIDFLRETYIIDASTEISIELNPTAFTLDSVVELIEYGFSRFSVGVQSFDENTLKLLNRGHSEKDVMKAIDVLDEARRKTPKIKVSWDLLVNLPYETSDPIGRASSLIRKYSPDHLSVYSLILEPESVFSVKKGFKEYVAPMPSQDQTADTLESVHNRLADLGYIHYEISSFARESSAFCLHNEIYWENLDFLGFGMGATSLFGNLRVSRPHTLKKYFDYVETLKNLRIPAFFEELKGNKGKLGSMLKVEDESGMNGIKVRLMGGLRTLKGVNLEGFPEDVLSILRRFASENEEIIEITRERRLKVKGLRGFMVCDEILALLFSEFERNGLL